ncbi:hypothetical protein ACFWIB_40780 [Streptomyces sp. NPDC127051]|uniref:hypothetical protein n=1 Tax=Streptomyces sp. NPDC127051 TaxID=3347119 RepID=UPI0036522AC5
MRTRHSFPTLRSVGLWLLLCQALALAISTPANAHGDTIKVVVTGQREGHVTANLTWENDADPIDEAVAATVNAVSPDGTRSTGPWKLVRDPGTEADWTTVETLPPGNWKVTVDVGFPALGHGDREVAVPVVDPVPTSPPTTTRPSASHAPDTPATPSSTPSPSVSVSAGMHTVYSDPDGGYGPLMWIMIALSGIACGMLLRLARARRLPHRGPPNS